MRREVLQRDFLRAAQKVLDGTVVENGLERRHGLAVLAHHLMVEIEGLAPRNGAERHLLLDVRGERRVAAVLVAARERRRGNRLLRLHGQFLNREALALAVLGKTREVVDARLFLQGLPCLHGYLAVRRRREAEHGICGLLRRVDGRTAIGDVVLVLNDAVAALDFLVLRAAVPGKVQRAHLLRDIRPERDPLLVEVLVVAHDRHELRHGLARHRLTLALAPVANQALGLRQLPGAVMLHRHGHDIVERLDIGFFRDVGDRLRERTVDIPVRAGLPQRVDRRLERMHKGMHIRGGQVILLVPRRRRQYDIGVERRARHAEINVDEQIELALGRTARLRDIFLRMPVDFLRLVLRLLLGKHRILRRAQQILHEEVVALGRGTEQVRSPDKEVAREVLRRIRILHGELEALVLQRVYDILRVVLARLPGLLKELFAALLERRVRGQPAEACGEHVVVRRIAVTRLCLQRRDEVGEIDFVAAPLIRGEIIEARAVLQARRRLPVRRRHDARPALSRTQLLLADIVRPATTVATLAGREQQQVQDGAVDDIRVEPVVDAAAHDDHGLAVGLQRIIRKLARRMDAGLCWHARVFLLPFRRVGYILLVGVRALTADTAVDGIVRERQVVDRRHEHLRAVRLLDALGRHGAFQHAVLTLVAKVRQRELHDLVHVAEHGELRRDRLARIAVLLAQVPLLLAIPAIAHRAIRHHELARALIDDIVFELRMMVITPHILAVEEPARLIAAILALRKLHEEREIRVAACVVREELCGLPPVVLVQDHVAHGHRERRIAADLQRDPGIGHGRGLRIIRCDGDDLRALIARLGEEVRIRRTRQRHIGAPGDDIVRVEPV